MLERLAHIAMNDVMGAIILALLVLYIGVFIKVMRASK